jgi:hypothetical protein
MLFSLGAVVELEATFARSSPSRLRPIPRTGSSKDFESFRKILAISCETGSEDGSARQPAVQSLKDFDERGQTPQKLKERMVKDGHEHWLPAPLTSAFKA